MQFSNNRVRFTGMQGRFQQAVRIKGEEGRQGPKGFKQGKTISKGLTDWGRVGAELLQCMERAGSRQTPLSLYLYSLSPLSPSSGNNSDSPKSHSYLLSCTACGRRALRLWLLFLLLPPLTGAMWVPQLSSTSPKASSGSHNSSFLRWRRRRRQTVPAAETPTPLFPYHQSCRSVASDYCLVPPMLKGSLKDNTSNRSITVPQNPHTCKRKPHLK